MEDKKKVRPEVEVEDTKSRVRREVNEWNEENEETRMEGGTKGKIQNAWSAEDATHNVLNHKRRR